MIAALLLLVMSSAGSSTPVALAPTVEKVVADYDQQVVAVQARLAALAPYAGLAANLAARVSAEQDLRRALPNFSALGLNEVDRRTARGAIWQKIEAIDWANTAYLKSILPADGWFRESRDGRMVALNAWVIAQHSPDPAFQRQVVRLMEPLVAIGEANGGNYALLYDRTELSDGRPQRYGSQMRCEKGRWVQREMEEPAQVDARRASVGLSTLAEYRKSFERGC